ncbi:Hypothetical predicted protein [Paramuricea clavata]|uniref:Uncharacterized protein n=1 Tax=Paramuricea clavata TaxID=317549 RepID=A0A7D9HLA3_PARCT|nr:Hypothetical predicted protein [Paramuricea clavata]
MDYNSSDRRSKQRGKSKGLSSHEQKVKLWKDRNQQLPLLKKIKAAPSLNKTGLKDPFKKIPTAKKLVKESYFGIPQYHGEKTRPIQKKFDIYALKDGLPHLPKASKEINNQEQGRKGLEENEEVSGFRPLKLEFTRELI